MKAAIVQLEAAPAPTGERLERAGRLAAAAARQGAQVVVLPEVFNTGYAYTPDNYRRAEPIDGPTPGWMRQTAARLGVHLAGSFLLAEAGQIYNAMLLFAPDGRMWRYDKRYPWSWERAYFRPGRGVTVAETDLGRLGMLVCWDVAHADLWRAYAGRVDAMLVCSCPPDASNPTYVFPNGDALGIDRLGPLFARLKDATQQAFGAMVDQQTAWLGVPCLATVACGAVSTPIPAARASFLTFLPSAPWLAKYLGMAGQMRLSAPMVEGGKILDRRGQPLVRLNNAQGEGFCLAEIDLPAPRPRPDRPQPAAPVSRLAYWISDRLLPGLVWMTYRRGLAACA